jgi:hypothetical protein
MPAARSNAVDAGKAAAGMKPRIWSDGPGRTNGQRVPPHSYEEIHPAPSGGPVPSVPHVAAPVSKGTRGGAGPPARTDKKAPRMRGISSAPKRTRTSTGCTCRKALNLASVSPLSPKAESTQDSYAAAKRLDASDGAFVVAVLLPAAVKSRDVV